MIVRQNLFLLIGDLIRAIPRIRGKVRLGHTCYRWLRLAAAPFTFETTLFPEKLRFLLSMNCAHERMAYLMNAYEDETSRFLADLFQGGAMLDVGANIGLIALPFAVRSRHQANTGTPHVIAVEALPSNFEVLRHNIERNTLGESISAMNIGLGARSDNVFIQIEGDDPVMTGTANILPSGRDFKKIPLQIHAIDALIGEGRLPRDISLIKIDTDGWDFEILKGAEKMLREGRPLVYAELMEHCLNWHGYGIAEVIAFMKNLDYQTWVCKSLNPPNFKPMSGGDAYTKDCLLVPNEQAAALATRLH